MENPVIEVDVTADPPGNPRVLWISVPGVFARFCGLGNVFRARPFSDQVVRFQRHPGARPGGDGALFRGRRQHPARHLDGQVRRPERFHAFASEPHPSPVFGYFAQGYYAFLLLGTLLGLGGASFVVGNAHVSSWYPKSKQGTALGIFAMGNVGITVGMVTVTFLITRVLSGPDGWRLIFPIFAVCNTVDGAGLLVLYVRSAEQEAQEHVAA